MDSSSLNAVTNIQTYLISQNVLSNEPESGRAQSVVIRSLIELTRQHIGAWAGRSNIILGQALSLRACEDTDRTFAAPLVLLWPVVVRAGGLLAWCQRPVVRGQGHVRSRLGAEEFDLVAAVV